MGAPTDQFGCCLGSTVAEAGDHDMITQLPLGYGHTPPRLHTLEQKIVSRPQEDEPHEQPDWCEDESIEQSRLSDNRHDIAVSDGRDGDHGKIEDVGKGDWLTRGLAQAFAIKTMNRQRDADKLKRTMLATTRLAKAACGCVDKADNQAFGC